MGSTNKNNSKTVAGRWMATLGLLVFVFVVFSPCGYAQTDGQVSTRIDAKQISVGDQARMFITVEHKPANSRLQWAVIPDSFNTLEVVEKGKIDTVVNGDVVTYRQRLIITGFDSGLFRIPSFAFSVIPNSGTPYTLQTDSLELLVQTVAVDTTKGFKGIKGILFVKSTWLDYLWYILGAIVFIVLVVYVALYFLRNKKTEPPKPQGPQETLQEYTLRLLSELDAKQMWQKKQVKEYYVELTDILRNYIEARFQTPALELTTDELLYKAQLHRELQPHQQILADILHMADLAKFAKAQPLPQEHTEALDKAKAFIANSKPVVISEPKTENTNPTE